MGSMSSCIQRTKFLFGLHKNFDIVVLAGESNMIGRSLDNDIAPAVQNIFQLGRYDEYDGIIIPGVDPLHHKGNQNGTGPSIGLTFAKSYVRCYPNSNILLIPCAVSGTGFNKFTLNNWNPGDPEFNDMILRITTVMSWSPKSKVIAVLWLQGESDVATGTSRQDYRSHIVNMIKTLQNGTCVRGITSSTQFIFGELCHSDTPSIYLGHIQNVIDTLHHDVNTTKIVSNIDEKGIPLSCNPRDRIHYNSPSLTYLGGQYFEEFNFTL
jgi:hypothetical protein